jgi:hypothetical protein
VKAEALSAGAQQTLPDPARVVVPLPVGPAIADYPQAALPVAARWRASLLGLGLGALALAAAAVVALLIVTGLFHTSIGDLA